MILARNIRYLRQRRGWSLADLANTMGYRSLTTVAKWESGVNEPPLKSVHELARIFNVDIDTLVKVDLEMENPLAQRYAQVIETQTTEQPTAPEWYDGLTEEQKQAVKLIAHLPEEQLNILLRVAEQMQLPRSQETE